MFFQQSRIQKRKVQQDQDQVFFNHEKEMNAYLVCNEFCLFFLFSILLPYKLHYILGFIQSILENCLPVEIKEEGTKNGKQIFVQL